MTLSTGKRRFHFNNAVPKDPAITAYGEWPSLNRDFFVSFRRWLSNNRYGLSALNSYCVAARLALGWLNKPYWQIDPAADLQRVRDYLTARYPCAATRAMYLKGLAKLEQYLRFRCHRPVPDQPIAWDHYLRELPAGMAADLRAYFAHCRRNWPADRQRRFALSWISSHTHLLRGLLALAPLTTLEELTPAVWFAYVDQRLAAGISPVSLNSQLFNLLGWLHFLEEAGRPVCQRMLKVKPLAAGPHLPRDVPVEHLRRLLQAIQATASASLASTQRLGLMDQAWFLLMLHSGLRTGEVRSLKLTDIDWENRRVRIEQSKGLKDRLAPLSDPAIQALKAYLSVRGPAAELPEQVFIYRHVPLTESYCSQRLCKYYRKRTGIRISPHQLRFSCATLLLNAGAPVLTVQTILGHRHIDTTLGYARLYDGTLAADYYSAMAQVESRITLVESAAATPPGYGELLALVDSLRGGTLNEAQANTARALRAGLMARAEGEAKKGPDSRP